MKSREQKESLIKSLKERFEGSTGVVLAGYKGLTVTQISQLRNELKPVGTRFTVLKNTLARIASQGTAYESLIEGIEGPRAAAFVDSDAAPTLKILFRLTKDLPALELFEGLIEGARLDNSALKAYSELPTKDEVRSIFCGLLQAPMARLVSVLNAPGVEMVGVLKAYLDKQENGQASSE